jgi:ribosome-binding protein aMBF1 (putative translation factor)
VHGGIRRKGLKIGFAPKNLGGAELVKLGMSQCALAEQLGCSQPQVHGWMRGRTVPTGRWRAVMEDCLGIYWRLWDQPVARDKSEAA